MDAFYFGSSDDERSHAYQLVNLNLGYEHGRWRTALYARNALNEHYAVRGFFFADEPGQGAKRYIQNADPRQVGLRVSFNF